MCGALYCVLTSTICNAGNAYALSQRLLIQSKRHRPANTLLEWASDNDFAAVARARFATVGSDH
jgi:hypothetical protein